MYYLVKRDDDIKFILITEGNDIKDLTDGEDSKQRIKQVIKNWHNNFEVGQIRNIGHYYIIDKSKSLKEIKERAMLELL